MNIELTNLIGSHGQKFAVIKAFWFGDYSRGDDCLSLHVAGGTKDGEILHKSFTFKYSEDVKASAKNLMETREILKEHCESDVRWENLRPEVD